MIVCIGIEVKVKDNDEVIDDIEVAILVLETVTLLLTIRTFLTTPPPLLSAAPELILLVLDHVPLSFSSLTLSNCNGSYYQPLFLSLLKDWF